jgi:hypothetical protein
MWTRSVRQCVLDSGRIPSCEDPTSAAPPMQRRRPDAAGRCKLAHRQPALLLSSDQRGPLRFGRFGHAAQCGMRGTVAGVRTTSTVANSFATTIDRARGRTRAARAQQKRPASHWPCARLGEPDVLRREECTEPAIAAR